MLDAQGTYEAVFGGLHVMMGLQVLLHQVQEVLNDLARLHLMMMSLLVLLNRIQVGLNHLGRLHLMMMALLVVVHSMQVDLKQW